jgi:preprotein translocase subunit SecA
MVLLQSLDQHWREHLAALDYLRQGIHLRGYAQKQPKQEYKREAFELFGQMLDAVKNEVTRTLMTVQVQTQEQAQSAAETIEQRAQSLHNLAFQHPEAMGGMLEADDADAQAQAEAAIAAAAAPGVQQVVNALPKVGRNDPCPCGSGKKYKQCHGRLS